MRLHKVLLQILLLVSVALPVIILAQYRLHMSGEISYDREDWGVFGSVLGGAFTLVGGLATSFTLLFLYDQQKKNYEVVQKQLSSLTFEQYVQHLLHFKAVMQSAGARNRIVFRDLDRLYQVVFPANRPTFCTFDIDYSFLGQESVARRLKRMLGDCASHTINSAVQTEAANAVGAIYQIKKYLDIDFDSNFPGSGKLLVDGKRTGLFLDKLEFQVKSIESIVDELLFFGGGERVLFTSAVQDWVRPTRKLITLAATSQSGNFKVEYSDGIIGMIKLYELTKSDSVVPGLSKNIEELYLSDRFVDLLQPVFVKTKGAIFAKALVETPDYFLFANHPEVEAIRMALVEYFDVDYRYFTVR